jgi:hypothetical protein
MFGINCRAFGPLGLVVMQTQPFRLGYENGRGVAPDYLRSQIFAWDDRSKDRQRIAVRSSPLIPSEVDSRELGSPERRLSPIISRALESRL